MPDDSMVPVTAEPRTEVDILRDRVHFLETSGIVELAVINPNVMDYMRHWEGRAEKAEARITTLERELVEALEKNKRQATEIQRMARKIRNQRGMARTTWTIVESRAKWARGILSRNLYLARYVASQAEVERLRAALKPFAKVADMLVFSGATTANEIELSGEQLFGALMAARAAITRQGETG